MANNGGGCLRKVVVWAVVVVLVVIVAKSCGIDLNPFGSSVGCDASAAGPVAHADDDGCPDYLRDAITDPAWAREQQDAIRGNRLTTGRYMTSATATAQQITSGYGHLSDLADGYLRDSDDFDYPSRGKPNVITDVETKLAAAMRSSGVATAVVAINHPQVCDGVLGCKQAVPAILPEGSVLYVWELGKDQPVTLAGKATP